MSLVTDLASIVGPAHCIAPPPPAAQQDSQGRPGGPAAAFVRPASAAELAAVAACCGAAGTPMQIQGGNTGLVRGQVPSAHSDPATVIISTVRLHGIRDIAPGGQQLTADAGTTIAQLHTAAARVARVYGVDLASRDSATVGGTIATNAGGIRVCAYGSTRQQVLGVEAVLADGSLVGDLRGLAKDNTGYDLASLLCGSEGTLAVVTAARLRLHSGPPAPSAVALTVESLAEGYELAHGATAGGFPLMGAEFVDHTSWSGFARAEGLPDPVPGDGAYVLLLEVGDGASGAGFGPAVVNRPDAVVALDPRAVRALWQIREGQSEYWSRLGRMAKFDVSLPPAALDEAMRVLAERFASWSVAPRWGVFGHIHEANLHIEVIADVPGPELSQTVLTVIADHGGSISAEHGIGHDKAAWLGLRHSDAEIALMRRIKKAFDPGDLLNPGVLLPPRRASA